MKSQFVSPVVSHGGGKMGKFRITREESSKYSTCSNTTICILLMTSADYRKMRLLV
jgi:hypothetical protein